MDYASFRSVLAMLSVLGMFVAIVTNIWRFGNIDLTGRWANMRGIYGRAIAVGVVLAALLRANIIDILQNPEGPALMLGWLAAPWSQYAGATEKIVGTVEEVFGILVTGVVLAFISKFWNDLFDIVYEVKRWLRGKANALKPEDGAIRPKAPGTVAPSDRDRDSGITRRGSRGGRGRRGGRPQGGSDRGGDRGGGDRGGGDRGGGDR
jgi:uncharacterized membrane protein YgcG